MSSEELKSCPEDCQSKEDGICRLPIGSCKQCAQPITHSDIEKRKIVIQAMLEVIQGYYSKIITANLSVEEILDTLEKDKEFLQQEQNVIDASSIL